MAWIRKLCALRAAGLLRVALLVAAVQFIGLALWLRSAHARAGEALLSVGAELMKLDGSRPGGPARTLFLNGSRIHLRTATTDRSVQTVLDGFHSLCRRRSGVETPIAALDRLRGNSAKPGAALPALDGVLRTQTDTEGALACIDTGARLSVSELTERLQVFAKTGDLNAVGELRYVLARRVDGKTAVLMLWTEGSTPLLSMFPTTGDAPGQDPPGIARAPGTRRLVSAWESDEPYSLAVYAATAGETAALVGFYENSLRAQGWIVQMTATKTDGRAVTVITARRSGSTVVLRIGRDSHGKLVVTVATLG
jgi:hypothetical protein